MNPLEIPLTEQVAGLLARGAPLTMAQLMAATGKSQPSLSLALSALGDRAHQLGAARSTRYTLTQSLYGLPAQQPLVWTGKDGHSATCGSVTLLGQGQTHVRLSGSGLGPREWLTQQGLPWFLTPLRPQGFLGRPWCRLRPDFPNDPKHWTAAQVLYIAANHATDPPGALDVGALQSVTPADPADLSHDAPTALAAGYDALAHRAGEGLPAGSSAGGEQAKFTVRHSPTAASPSWRHCIVKFSPPRGTPFGDRWHDLLHLEHLAHTVLGEQGLQVAATQVVESATRTYLESTRFDRIGPHGKRHVVAAAAVHDEFVNLPRQHWVATAQALVAQRRLSAEDLKSVALQYAFGQYIANTDMHFGNLSFFVDDIAKPQFVLTPAYDMLPMMWRPSIHTGDLGVGPVREQPPLVGHAAEVAQARAWAIDFWQRASQLAALSSDLHQTCTNNVQRLKSNFASL